MNNTAQVRRAANVVYQPLAGEDGAVLLHLDTGAYHGLNPVGERIWQLLESPRTEAELIALLAADFDADEAVLTADLEVFLGSLRERKLVERESPS